MKYNEPDITQAQEETLSLPSGIAPGEIVIGTLVDTDKQGQPLVDFSENPANKPLKAIATLVLTQRHVGRQVALLFTNGNLQNPVIMGMIHSPLQDMLENFGQFQTKDEPDNETRNDAGQEGDLKVDDVLVDGQKIIFEAKDKIVLKCGKSSIILTKDGKVSIRGKNVLSRATGTHQIKGSAFQVN